MNNYKRKLSEAIQSVFTEMFSMSTEKLQSKVKRYLYDERTSALLYAWDNIATEYPGIEDNNFDMKDISTVFKTTGLENIDTNHLSFPSLFVDYPQIDSIFDDQTYDKGIVTSDDYYMFQAAA